MNTSVGGGGSACLRLHFLTTCTHPLSHRHTFTKLTPRPPVPCQRSLPSPATSFLAAFFGGIGWCLALLHPLMQTPPFPNTPSTSLPPLSRKRSLRRHLVVPRLVPGVLVGAVRVKVRDGVAGAVHRRNLRWQGDGMCKDIAPAGPCLVPNPTCSWQEQCIAATCGGRATSVAQGRATLVLQPTHPSVAVAGCVRRPVTLVGRGRVSSHDLVLTSHTHSHKQTPLPTPFSFTPHIYFALLTNVHRRVGSVSLFLPLLLPPPCA